MATTTKREVVTRIGDGYNAIVITILAKNADGSPIIDSQKALAEQMAKNVLQMAGAEADANSSAFQFAAEEIGKNALVTVTVEATDEPNVEAVDKPTPEVEEPEADETEEPTETDAEE